jgi:xanthosine utilization system XapX-like protein
MPTLQLVRMHAIATCHAQNCLPVSGPQLAIAAVRGIGRVTIGKVSFISIKSLVEFTVFSHAHANEFVSNVLFKTMQMLLLVRMHVGVMYALTSIRMSQPPLVITAVMANGCVQCSGVSVKVQIFEESYFITHSIFQNSCHEPTVEDNAYVTVGEESCTANGACEEFYLNARASIGKLSCKDKWACRIFGGECFAV